MDSGAGREILLAHSTGAMSLAPGQSMCELMWAFAHANAALPCTYAGHCGFAAASATAAVPLVPSRRNSQKEHEALREMKNELMAQWDGIRPGGGSRVRAGGARAGPRAHGARGGRSCCSTQGCCSCTAALAAQQALAPAVGLVGQHWCMPLAPHSVWKIYRLKKRAFYWKHTSLCRSWCWGPPTGPLIWTRPCCGASPTGAQGQGRGYSCGLVLQGELGLGRAHLTWRMGYTCWSSGPRAFPPAPPWPLLACRTSLRLYGLYGGCGWLASVEAGGLMRLLYAVRLRVQGLCGPARAGGPARDPWGGAGWGGTGTRCGPRQVGAGGMTFLWGSTAESQLKWRLKGALLAVPQI